MLEEDEAGLVTYSEEREQCRDQSATRRALFGDFHVHTSFSFDTYIEGYASVPADAYRYAQGETIAFPGPERDSVTIDRPLDFVAVTDHSEFLGERYLCGTEGSDGYDTPFCAAYRVGGLQALLMLGQVLVMEEPKRVPAPCGEDGSVCREAAAPFWAEMQKAAEEAYDRSEDCSFTTFVAYEHTGTPGTSNYHRNVIFRNANVPALPISYIEAPNSEALWQALDGACTPEGNCEVMAIPHNSNLGNGRLLSPPPAAAGLEARRAFAETRQRLEPVMEIFQHKGNSECINGLSSVLGAPDELCNFEQLREIGRTETIRSFTVVNNVPVPQVIDLPTLECAEGLDPQQRAFGMLGAGCVSPYDYYRSTLVEGLREERETGANPAKFGAIGSTDTHLAIPGGTAEANWPGHVVTEVALAGRMVGGFIPTGIEGNPGGVTGVWAVENSRDAIFDALKRREAFGTSGPHIAPRFFGGWLYADDLCGAGDLLDHAYAEGVPMGSDLVPEEGGGAPRFVALAEQDPAAGSTPLQKLQVVKGWVDEDGGMHTVVHDIAGDPEPKGSVDKATGERTGEGHASLCTVFEDPDFEPDVPAYYYLRVVENPSPRWSLLQCLGVPEEERAPACTDPNVPQVIQEQAWTSPIWYRPDS